MTYPLRGRRRFASLTLIDTLFPTAIAHRASRRRDAGIASIAALMVDAIFSHTAARRRSRSGEGRAPPSHSTTEAANQSALPAQ